VDRNIVAIGGGSVGDGETFSIDRRFVCLADAETPNLLFIPTASMDSPDYAAEIESVYGDRLGCKVQVLRLWSEDRWLPQIVAKLEAADLIYVGGGNTKAMLQRWQELGVDREIRRVVANGKPVAGLSAGAICWFRVGNSDWPQYEQIPNVLTDRLDCLGIVDLVACPHTSRESFRLQEFRHMMQSESGVGIGLDDCCAIQIQGDRYRLLSSQPEAGAHLIYRHGDEVVHQFLAPHSDFRSLAELQGTAVG